MKMKSSQEIDIHFQALCNAVEHEKLEKAKSILEQHPELRLDTINGDGFTPLDLAFMTGNSDILRLLLQHRLDDEDDLEEDNDDDGDNEADNNASLLEGRLHGRAIEGDVFASPDAVSVHLKNLMQESKKQVEKFGQLIKAASTNQPVSVIATTLGASAGLLNTTAAANLTQAQLKECEKQQNLWHKRLVSLKKMLNTFEASGCPHAPSTVNVSVTGQTSIKVQVSEPDPVGPHSLFTKFKVQWSHLDTFTKISGERIVLCSSDEGQRQECIVNNLEEGRRYFVRASFGNPKGFGPFSASSPKSVVPSTWRSVQKKEARIKNQMDLCVDVLDDLMSHINNSDQDSQEVSVKVKRKGLLQLFTSGVPKFQKSVMPHRLHICVLLFHEDRILMTNDDALPMIVVDEAFNAGGSNFSSHQLNQEFHWFAKLCHMWDDVAKLKREMSKVINGITGGQRSTSSSAVSQCGTPIAFRIKVLQAVATLQTHLSGLDNDLGSAFWHPFMDHGSSVNGSIIFTAVRHIRQPKSLVSLSLKWVHLSRVHRSNARLPDLGTLQCEESMDQLKQSIRQQILFNQVCNISLNRGLFLCYLQARSTVDGTIEVAVCKTSPSILPYIKLRDNPHVNSDEWSWIHRLASTQESPTPKPFAKHNNIHAPSPTTNFLGGENEEGAEHSVAIPLNPTEEQYAFGRLLDKNMERLFEYLEIDQSDRSKHRLYFNEVIELSDDVSVILVLPPSESICFLETSDDTVSTNSCCSINLNRNDLMLLPLPMFELVHYSAYHIELLVSYIRAMSFLDLELVVAKQIHRESITNDEVSLAQRSLNIRNEQHQQLEEAWRSMRWIPDVINHARSRTNHCGLTYESLSLWYSHQPDVPDDAIVFAPNNSNGSSEYHSASGYVSRRQSQYSVGSASRQLLSRTPTTRSDPSEFKASMDDSYVRYYTVRPDGKVVPEDKENWSDERRAQDHPKKKKSQLMDYDVKSNGRIAPDMSRKLSLQHFRSEQLLQQAQQLQHTNSSRASGSFSSAQSNWKISDGVPAPSSSKFEPNVLQVYAAYHSGLANGTSVKLNVTHATTAREVVDLVVKQLNMAVIIKGRDGPVYEKEDLKNFCLVAVIGSRERCLRDDFRPLNLQNPWKSGKLFVRMKNDLLAAFERTGIEAANTPVETQVTTATTTLL